MGQGRALAAGQLSRQGTNIEPLHLFPCVSLSLTTNERTIKRMDLGRALAAGQLSREGTLQNRNPCIPFYASLFLLLTISSYVQGVGHVHLLLDNSPVKVRFRIGTPAVISMRLSVFNFYLTNTLMGGQGRALAARQLEYERGLAPCINSHSCLFL